MKLIRKHQSGSKFIKPDITNKSDYFNKSNIVPKNIPSIEELIKKQSDQFNNAVLSQKGTLTNLGGSPDTDNRTQYERNKDYLNSNFNAERFERGATNFVKGIKPYAGAAATAFGATAVIPASYGAWGIAGGTALKGGVTGMGLGQLGVGSGDVKSDFIAGAMGESLPIIGRNVIKSGTNLINRLNPYEKYYHFSSNPNLALKDIDVLRPGVSQLKKKYIGKPIEELPGGFYTNKLQGQSFMGGKYGFEMKVPKKLNIKDLASEGKITDRMPIKDLQSFKNEGFDVIKGKNMVGEEE